MKPPLPSERLAVIRASLARGTDLPREDALALVEEIDRLGGANERLLTQLAGCSVAATGNATGPNDCARGDYGWSPAFDDVKKLRAERDELAAQVTSYTEASP